MVAKFHEKCEMSAAALEQIKRQINRKNKSDEIATIYQTEADSNTETFYENVEFTEDNVEYVIYDADLIEETDDQDKSHIIQSDEIEMDCEEIHHTQVCTIFHCEMLIF